ncbi:glycerophosphodiester phosphodiesterase family protein [uncultured Ruminococcus sp.]|uniref:glycerophosphodiester phosphodiesterase family protein n=1 Tax=uncultured Ruminococcus sp. TaxID=165186 RepID=UPI00292F5E7C|nr:glycerophosphodiester phosphodiesterase family protein [uncultured Ruminococcus sp.]
MKLKQRFQPFLQAIPKLLLFQFVSTVILTLVTWGISLLGSLLLGLSGKAAVTSGDLSFLFTRWQGYVMIILLLAMVTIYVAVELNALIIFCNKTLDGEKVSVWQCIKEGFIGLKKFLSLRGVVVILYAVVLAPIFGLGFSISLTQNFYIPKFIMSVIEATPLFMTAYIIVGVFLTVVAFVYCFILHGTLLNDMTMKEASVHARKLFVKNWKNLLVELLIFFLLAVLTAVVVIGVCGVLPLLIVQAIPMGESVKAFFTIFFSVVIILLCAIAAYSYVSLLMIKLTSLYKKYTSEGEEWSYQPQEKKRHPVVITVVALLLVASIGFSVYAVGHFDELFKTQVDGNIVAHRAAGVEAPENTVKGIDVAYQYGALGSEIDIQRTSDGYYVVNHDADFERVAGVAKAPEEMTLAEVKELRVDGEPVPTLEEMLDASKDKVILFVELKGATADNQMADDAVRIIKEKGMQDQAVLISLKMDILEYIEEKYPEMQTGYLAFVSLGYIEETPFDYLALEEEISTDETIESVHQKGKKIIVWTVNDEEDIEHFMLSDADAIITDSVKLSGEVKERLSNRSTSEIIFQQALRLVQ